MNKVTIICGVYTDNKNNWHCYLGRKGGSLVPSSECSTKEIAELLLNSELDSLKSQYSAKNLDIEIVRRDNPENIEMFLQNRI